MSTPEAKIQNTQRLLKKHGIAVVIKNYTKVENVSEPWKPLPNAESSESVYSVEDMYEEKLIDGERIQLNDKILYLSPLQTNDQPLTRPSSTSVVISEEFTWSVVRAKPVTYKGKVVLYQLQVRT